MVVRALDQPLSTVIEVIQHDREGKHHRGQVMAVGPSVKLDDKYRPRTDTDTRVGDVIHFMDIYKFPTVEMDGERLLILQEADVGAIEEA